MRNRGQLVFGAILVLLGLMFLFGTVFNINVGALCWPIALIVVGVWLVFRPRLVGPDRQAEVLLLGELRRRGEWAVHNEEFWLGVGDADLDLLQATFPPGETTLSFNTFVSDVDVYVPRTVGVAIRVTGFVVDTNLLDQHLETFLSPVEVTSDNFASADCRLRIEMTSFVANLKVRQM